jgi:transcriptional regulator with XRE-family HTH domain
MARRFQELIDEMSPERRAEFDKNVKKLRAQTRLDDMRLPELRKALRLSQQTLARRLKTGQAQISRLEQRTDLFVSTLRRYVEALGGQLEIIASFPEGATIRIENFSDLRPEKPRHRGRERRAPTAKSARRKTSAIA